MAERIFAVTTAHGPEWDAARPPERQADWEAHADFMNALEAEGVVLIGGTLDDAPGAAGRSGSGGALLVVRARDAEDVRWRLAADPWVKAGLLRVESVRAWTLRLGEDFEERWVPARARAQVRRAGRAQGMKKPRKAYVGVRKSREKPTSMRGKAYKSL